MEQNYALNGVLDIVELNQLYVQLSNIVGEPLMESLNVKLKQKLLIAPLIMALKQGFINDLMYRLTSRDIESNKQILQLILDNLQGKYN